MSTGENIRWHRETLHLSLEDVAAQVGISRQTLSRYETGKITNIPQENIEALAKALQTTPSTLMGWTDQLLADLSKETEEGRTQAKEKMYQTFGIDHRASDLRLMGEQIVLLYYSALERNLAPELLNLIQTAEKLDCAGLAKINQVVEAYLHARGHIREIVDTALKIQKQND